MLYIHDMVQGFDYSRLISILRSYETEEEWFEFKVGNSNPERIGAYVSGLANSACLSGHPFGYIIWGIDDASHEVVGTDFHPASEKIGNQELLGWLVVNSSPRLSLDFIELEIEGKHVILLEVPAAVMEPVRFKGDEFIRIGSELRELKRYPECERALWKRFDMIPEERHVVQSDLDLESVSRLLDFDSYFIIQNLPIPSTREEMVSRLIQEGFVSQADNHSYSISVLGALLFARDLTLFPRLALKPIRIILYRGNGRLNAVNDIVLREGYAIAFEKAAETAAELMKKAEVIEGGLREDVRLFPLQAVREMLGNIIIHQDLSAMGSGPLLEIFDTRIEASNPGKLLVPRERIIDAPPTARNEALAAFLRRIHVCEERGSGFDRMEEAMASMKLPSPLVETGENFTRIRLFWYPSFTFWNDDDRIRTIYMTACLKYIESETVTNNVIRERLGLNRSSSAVVSRYLKEVVGHGLLRIRDEGAGTKARQYVPYWA